MKVLTCSLVAFVTVVACANMLLNPAFEDGELNSDVQGWNLPPNGCRRLGCCLGRLYCGNKLEPSRTVVSALGSSASALMVTLLL